MFYTITYKNLLYSLALLFIALISVDIARDYYKFEQALVEARKITPDSWDERYKDTIIKDKYKVVIVTSYGGEQTYVEYFKYVAEKKGWQVKIFYAQTNGYEDNILAFDPDFILFTCHFDSLIDPKIRSHKSKKYSLNLVSFYQLRWSRDVDSQDIYTATNKVARLNDIVDGIFTVATEVDVYRIMFEKLGKPFYGLRLFPLVPRFENEPAEPNNLMWISSRWDAHRSSKTYKQFIKLLSDNVPMKIYGNYDPSFHLSPSVYDGYITPGIENIEIIKKNGIYLLTHSDLHFKGKGVPSMRIFEATAANAVVISDMHPFALEHFGDNFLYFDQNASAQEIYKQIKTHMDWIKANPEKAKAMADRAHKIFLKKFTLETDLARIAKMHEYILAQEK